jgi:hypothetical protein
MRRKSEKRIPESIASLPLVPKRFSIHYNFSSRSLIRSASKENSIHPTQHSVFATRKCLQQSDQNKTLEYMEKQVTNEEKRLMFISDIRKKCEDRKMISQSIENDNKSVSNQAEREKKNSLLYFLLTPRFAELSRNGIETRVVINLLPDKQRFKANRERYLIECKLENELYENKRGIGLVLRIEQIKSIELISDMINSIKINTDGQPIVFRFYSAEECNKYAKGLNLFLSHL